MAWLATALLRCDSAPTMNGCEKHVCALQGPSPISGIPARSLSWYIFYVSMEKANI